MDPAALLASLAAHGPLLLTAIHVATAGTVTIHALLRKRDVPAAIGWIGLAWLSPFFGPLLYLGFGINRVKRRARRLRGVDESGTARHRALAPAGPTGSLERAVGRITRSATELGTVCAVLECGDEAYPRMLAAIEAATSSVALSTFIFRTDPLGQSFIAALVRAHRRGVAVRVLIDGFGGGFLFSRAYHALRREGVPAARYLHSLLPWKMPLLDLRLHKKILLIDGRTAFLGGLNIGAENVLATRPREPVRDVHFIVEGPVVRQVMESFQDDWAFSTGELLDGALWLPVTHAAGTAPARVISSGPDQSVDQLMLVLLSAINAAASSLRIATPYFLPDEQVITALQLAALRGVEVDVVIPARNNHRLMGWAMQAHIRPLLKAGCRIWRSPAPFDHSKLVTMDEHWCLIGSANWDARSLRLNFEITMELYAADLAKRIGGLIDAKRGALVTLEQIDARWPIVKIRDAAARLLMPYL
ncbi:phospholipase D-like domain-containing protein [Bosea sp. (in: a-proteobacteria)]|uniref:phospholipase D-like domain-containing protein n=1 Tax=Bosea sp. (in: a-proteobacteria) TaxID=1871050 RepID=UPI0027329C33|nr:phospholipase D-like domain-containing protein [Bosea sp. (in: a-proteobacteria)]MDP3409135.1 phospholipase D-like domain-containing protein [Bosea sp. (in: a-proteobacteria)]